MAYKLFDEGEQQILDVYFRGAAPPAGFYIGLCNVTGGVVNMAETLTLATLTGEAAGNGYARQLIERSAVGWPSLALDAGDYMVTSSEESFVASGGSVGPVNVAFLATSADNTGRLIAAVDLSVARTMAAGETLKVTQKVKLQ